MSSKPILKDCVVSIAGDLDDHDWREEKVRQWVQYWGGTFTSTVDDSVTHLLCTEKNFKHKISAVRIGLKNKDTKIVLRDWLEDSINRKARLKTIGYQLDEKAKAENAKKRKIEKNEKAAANAENYIDEREHLPSPVSPGERNHRTNERRPKGFWHAYRDSTYFEHQVQLKRDDEESGNVGEKHLLTLWESNAKPHTYTCTTVFTKKSKNKAVRYALPGSPVDLAAGLKKFKAFFRKKTAIAWDDRIDKMGSTGPEVFQYTPPSGGKPLGLVNGHPASVFGNGGKDVTSSSASGHRTHTAAHEGTGGGEAQRTGIAADEADDTVDNDNTLRKRARDEHEHAEEAVNENRLPTKKVRFEDESTTQAGVADADANAETEVDGQDSCDGQEIQETGADEDQDQSDKDKGDKDKNEDGLAPAQNDEATTLEMARRYGEAQFAALHEDDNDDNYVGGDNLNHNHDRDHNSDSEENEKGDKGGKGEKEKKDEEGKGDPDATTEQQVAAARATSAAMYEEMLRGVIAVNDNQAYLIDSVRMRQRAKEARVAKQARNAAAGAAARARGEQNEAEVNEHNDGENTNNGGENSNNNENNNDDNDSESGDSSNWDKDEDEDEDMDSMIDAALRTVEASK
ncbi:hypothetical protein F4777DRAFT_574114 [Nemania sp. FL0916]|nr:hypothetical protein F4777DRAFT_574114 [Nemania sp. FL0916]